MFLSLSWSILRFHLLNLNSKMFKLWLSQKCLSYGCPKFETVIDGLSSIEIEL